MPKADGGSAKAISNAIKAKGGHLIILKGGFYSTDVAGLGRLRYYCQICEKQCRDENGFQVSPASHSISYDSTLADLLQAHCRSEPHMRKMMLVGPKAGQTIAEFSRQFQYDFMTLLKSRHSTQRVRANAVYNEYIQDKHHVHMNSTRWVTLSGFIATLGKGGLVKVDEDEKGIWISWVDNSPETLRKQVRYTLLVRRPS